MYKNSNSASTSTTFRFYVLTLQKYAGLLSPTTHVIQTTPKSNQITRITGMLHNEGYTAPVYRKKKSFQNSELTQNGTLQAFILLNLYQLGNSHGNIHPSYFHLIIF
jgi:hypothetical protein